MINVTRVPGGVNDYRQLTRSIWWWQVRRCPLCGRRLHLHGYYQRYADDGEQCVKIPVRRYRCPHCRRTFSYPPSFLRPYHSLLVRIQETAAQAWARGCRCGAWAGSCGGRWTPPAGMPEPGRTRHRAS